MKKLLFYPVLILPDYIEEFLRKSPRSIRTTSTPALTPGFYNQVLRLPVVSSKTLRWGTRLWLGLTSLAYFLTTLWLCYDWLHDSSHRIVSVILWAVGVCLITIFRGFGLSLSTALMAARNRDAQTSDLRYWDEVKKANQEYWVRDRRVMRSRYLKLKSDRQSIVEGVVSNSQLARKKLVREKKSLNSALTIKSQLTRGEIKADAPKGVSEAHLNNYLQQYFGKLCQICEEYFAIADTDVGYTTDFSVVDLQTGFGVDLEVDEPYEGKYKTPHHCTDNKSDKVRNEYLVERGWIVLRVSEYQVVTNPEGVCKLLGQVMFKLSGNRVYIDPLSDKTDLVKDECWNSVGVKNMVSRKYREIYLDKAGIFKYDEVRERRNQSELKEKQKLARREKAKRRRKNSKSG